MESTERFGYEWSKFNSIIPGFEILFLKWVYPLNPKDFRNKRVLDAGCGAGRNSYWPLVYGAKEVISIDYDARTVESARKNLSKFKNSNVKFESIYGIKYNEEFDIAFSIGVIHHLENPELAIKNLVKSVKKNGIVLLWVYGYEGNEWIVKYINPIRKVASRLPLPLVNFFANFLSVPLFLFIKIFKPSNPYLKQLSEFPFWYIHSLAFDQLIPRISNYWKKEEALKLLREKGLRNIKIYRVNENSWTVIGKKI